MCWGSMVPLGNTYSDMGHLLSALCNVPQLTSWAMTESM
jgi:hypothetical protein